MVISAARAAGSRRFAAEVKAHFIPIRLYIPAVRYPPRTRKFKNNNNKVRKIFPLPPIGARMRMLALGAKHGAAMCGKHDPRARARHRITGLLLIDQHSAALAYTHRCIHVCVCVCLSTRVCTIRARICIHYIHAFTILTHLYVRVYATRDERCGVVPLRSGSRNRSRSGSSKRINL